MSSILIGLAHEVEEMSALVRELDLHHESATPMTQPPTVAPIPPHLHFQRQKHQRDCPPPALLQQYYPPPPPPQQDRPPPALLQQCYPPPPPPQQCYPPPPPPQQYYPPPAPPPQQCYPPPPPQQRYPPPPPPPHQYYPPPAPLQYYPPPAPLQYYPPPPHAASQPQLHPPTQPLQVQGQTQGQMPGQAQAQAQARPQAYVRPRHPPQSPVGRGNVVPACGMDDQIRWVGTFSDAEAIATCDRDGVFLTLDEAIAIRSGMPYGDVDLASVVGSGSGSGSESGSESESKQHDARAATSRSVYDGTATVLVPAKLDMKGVTARSDGDRSSMDWFGPHDQFRGRKHRKGAYPFMFSRELLDAIGQCPPHGYPANKDRRTSAIVRDIDKSEAGHGNASASVCRHRCHIHRCEHRPRMVVAGRAVMNAIMDISDRDKFSDVEVHFVGMSRPQIEYAVSVTIAHLQALEDIGNGMRPPPGIAIVRGSKTVTVFRRTDRRPIQFCLQSSRSLSHLLDSFDLGSCSVLDLGLLGGIHMSGRGLLAFARGLNVMRRHPIEHLAGIISGRGREQHPRARALARARAALVRREMGRGFALALPDRVLSAENFRPTRVVPPGRTGYVAVRELRLGQLVLFAADADPTDGSDPIDTMTAATTTTATTATTTTRPKVWHVVADPHTTFGVVQLSGLSKRCSNDLAHAAKNGRISEIDLHVTKHNMQSWLRWTEKNRHSTAAVPVPTPVNVPTSIRHPGPDIGQFQSAPCAVGSSSWHPHTPGPPYRQMYSDDSTAPMYRPRDRQYGHGHQSAMPYMPHDVPDGVSRRYVAPPPPDIKYAESVCVESVGEEKIDRGVRTDDCCGVGDDAPLALVSLIIVESPYDHGDDGLHDDDDDDDDDDDIDGERPAKGVRETSDRLPLIEEIIPHGETLHEAIFRPGVGYNRYGPATIVKDVLAKLLLLAASGRHDDIKSVFASIFGEPLFRHMANFHRNSTIDPTTGAMVFDQATHDYSVRLADVVYRRLMADNAMMFATLATPSPSHIPSPSPSPSPAHF